MTVRVVTILGTSRPGNFTAKALSLVEDELRSREVEVKRIDPAAHQLVFPGEGEGDVEALKALVQSAAGIVFATPEYHGTMAAKAKLIIENLGFPSALATKPVALLGVAAGAIGAIKSLEQLRGTLSHTGAIVLPGAVSVAGVQRLFDAEGKCTDEQVEKRVRGVAASLLDYLEQSVCPRLTLEQMVRE